MNSKRQDLDMVFQTRLNTSVLKYRWEKTGLHGEVTETANDWNDIGRQALQQPSGKRVEST